ncbi:MAG: hypothetical protein IAF38_14625, partial [Bacteroidia bacterium]|nr:hypothetical protein [Bacteroidia bacterium]
MLKKIAFWLLVVCFIGGGIYAYLYLTAAKKPKVMALQAIPDDCVFIIESSDFFKLWKKLNETNLIWQELQQVEYFREIRETGKIIDSVLSVDDEVKEIFNENPVYLAGVEFEDKRDYLYALNVNMNKAGKLVDFVKRIAVDLAETETKTTKEKIWQFTLKTGKGHLFLYVKDGLALISQKPQILDRAIACINKNCVANDARFKKVSEMAGSSVDFRFYSNAAWSGKMYLNFLNRNSLFESLAAKQTKGWTEMDVDFKPNEMKVNGFTIPDSSSFLNYLAAQTPQEYKFINSVPQSTDNFLFLGLGDFSELYNKVEANVLSDVDRNNHKKLFSDLSDKVGMNLCD